MRKTVIIDEADYFEKRNGHRQAKKLKKSSRRNQSRTAQLVYAFALASVNSFRNRPNLPAAIASRACLIIPR